MTHLAPSPNEAAQVGITALSTCLKAVGGNQGVRWCCMKHEQLMVLDSRQNVQVRDTRALTGVETSWYFQLGWLLEQVNLPSCV